MRKQYDLDKHINIGEKSVLIVDVHFTSLSTHEKKYQTRCKIAQQKDLETVICGEKWTCH
jgi:hypothetical protein